MKSKEEIEQLAESIYHDRFSSNPFVVAESKGFIKGYNQCQEDTVNKIKEAIEYGYQLRCNNKPINSGIDWVKEFNSLNKQD